MSVLRAFVGCFEVIRAKLAPPFLFQAGWFWVPQPPLVVVRPACHVSGLYVEYMAPTLGVSRGDVHADTGRRRTGFR